MSRIQTRTYLPTWIQIPTIAYGTGSKWKGQDVTEYVEQAIEIGFNHIDTASCAYSLHPTPNPVQLNYRQSMAMKPV